MRQGRIAEPGYGAGLRGGIAGSRSRSHQPVGVGLEPGAPFTCNQTPVKRREGAACASFTWTSIHCGLII
ncbi:MAG: hypothetical protein ACYCYO_16975 [Bacilli bacterium]